MNTRSIRWTLEKHKPVHEVRRLLIDSVNGPGLTTLSQLIGTAHTDIATGTQYEVGQRADSLAQAWLKEGFESSSENGPPPYESLEGVIKIASILGHAQISIPNRLNPIGPVSLTQWRGLVPKNNGSYEYAFDGFYIHAQGALPPNHNLTCPKDVKEWPAFLAKVQALREAVGPPGKFLLL
jgi:hypothetical protein